MDLIDKRMDGSMDGLDWMIVWMDKLMGEWADGWIG